MKYFDKRLEGSLWQFKDNACSFKFSLYDQPKHSVVSVYHLDYNSIVMFLGDATISEGEERTHGSREYFSSLKFYKVMVASNNGECKLGWITSQAFRDLSPMNDEDRNGKN